MKKVLMALIRFYQKYLSGAKTAPTCRFVPTCSTYALQAIERHGAIIGGALAIWRIIRCTPFFKGGYDPVPENIVFRRERK